MPTPQQDIMNEGPGMKQRARETTAVGNEVMPRISAPPKAASPSAKDLVNPDAKYGTRGKEQRIDTTNMTKQLGMPSYKHGTDFVPETGPAMLHKGEAVTPAKDNMKNMYSKITEGDAKPKKEIKRMEHTMSHNGKHIVKHVHHHPMHEDETHVMNSDKELAKHMADHASMDGASAGGDDQMAQLTASPSPAPAAGRTARRRTARRHVNNLMEDYEGHRPASDAGQAPARQKLSASRQDMG